MLTASGLPEYYSPYPTLTTMRGQMAGGEGPDSKSQELAQRHRELAKEYGLDLPKRPADLTRGQAMTADILEAVDIIAAQIAQLSASYFRMAAKGGVPCEGLLAYNRMAIRFYEAQKAILAELRGEGVPGVPLAPPWPPLFVGFGNYAAAPADSFWEIDCKSDVVGLATTQNPDGIKVMLDKPCEPGGLTGAGLIVFGIIAGGALIYGIARQYIGATVEKATLRTELQSELNTLACFQWKATLIEKMADKCAKSRPNAKYEDCIYEAEQAVADMDCLEAQAQAKRARGGGKSWLWWVGLAAVVVGGVVVYKVVKDRRKGGGRKRGGAEIIEVD